MAKGHRSQIKREKCPEGYKTVCKAVLRKSIRSEGLFRIRCHQRQRCSDSTWYCNLQS